MTRPAWLGEDHRTWDHVRVHNRILEDGRLDALDLTVYIALVYHADASSGQAHPSQKKIADLARCKERRARDAITKLADLGLVAVEEQVGKPSIYRVLPPKTPAGDAGVGSDPGTTNRGVRQEMPGSPAPDAGVPPYMNKNQEQEPRTKEIVGPTSSEVVPLLPLDWGEFEFIRKICVELQAQDFIDAGFGYWQDIDKFLEGTEVYYDEVFRRYIDWWNDQPPGARHRNRPKAFKTWIRKDEARDRRRQRALAQKQVVGGRR